MVNHTIAHPTYAVSLLCLPHDFKQQTASATIITLALLAYKAILLQIVDSTFYGADKQMQFSCYGTRYKVPSLFALSLSPDIHPQPYVAVLFHIFIFYSTKHLILCPECLSSLCYRFIHQDCSIPPLLDAIPCSVLSVSSFTQHIYLRIIPSSISCLSA